MNADAQPSRRGFLRASCRFCSGVAGMFSGALAMTQERGSTPPVEATELPARFTRPAADTDEGGLWALMDRWEARLRRSPFVVNDDALNKYLQDMICRLNSEHCPDIRVHVMRTPWFNASMAPNGLMQVWSGLLLRVENDAQLAAVIAHELGHYLERHSVERMRDWRARAAWAQWALPLGSVGQLAHLGLEASAYAFTRAQEASADRMGVRLMQRAGWDGRQAAQVWDDLLAELKVTKGEDAGKRSPLFATHPPTVARRNELLRLAGDVPGRADQAGLSAVLTRHRFGWLNDEVKRGQFEESLVLFNRLLKAKSEDADVLFARAEVYRSRGGDTDLRSALDDLERVSRLPGAPAEAFRSLGLIYKRQSAAPAALRAFERYLALAPDAGDAGLIKSYVTELKP